MSALSRNAIVRGPGCFYLGSSPLAIPSVSGITAEPTIREVPILTDPDGEIDRRKADAEVKIAFTPVGLLTGDIVDALYPAVYRNPVRGTSAFGDADVPGLVHSVAGTKVTFHSVALTKMPSLFLSADKMLYGACEFTAIRGTGLEWTNPAALYTIASGAYSAPAVPSANVKLSPYSAAWGDAIASIVAEAGWSIDFKLALTADLVDGYGTNDYLINSVDVVAKCRPKNLSETILDSLILEGTGAGIGTSRRRGKDLVITGSNLTVTLYDAILQKGPCVWRGVEVRPGEIAFIAQRTETTGVYGALFALAVS